MRIDLSDVLIVLGALTAVTGMYFVAWPLVLVFVGAVGMYLGVRRL